MSKGWKRFFIVCLAVFATGTLLSIVGLIGGGVSGLSNGYHFADGLKAVENFQETKEQKVDFFQKIEVDVSASSVTLVPSEEYKVVVSSRDEYKIAVEDGTLIVDEEKRGKRYLFGINNNYDSQITIYYPKEVTLENLNISTEMGEITLDNVKWSTGTFKTDAGRIEGKNLESGFMDVETNLGEVDVQGTFTGKTNMEVDAGTITFAGVFLGETTVQGNMGDIKGTLTVPLSSFNYSIEADLGEVNVNGNTAKKQEGSSEEGNSLLIKNDFGTIDVTSP